ncbi:hypothetical protein PanWU01x14_245200, partial [Parasponia andersonii]
NHFLPRRPEFAVRILAARHILVRVPAVTQTLLLPQRHHSSTTLPLPPPLIDLNGPGRSQARELPTTHVTGRTVDIPEPDSTARMVPLPHDEAQQERRLKGHNLVLGLEESQRIGVGCGGGSQRHGSDITPKESRTGHGGSGFWVLGFMYI